MKWAILSVTTEGPSGINLWGIVDELVIETKLNKEFFVDYLRPINNLSVMKGTV